MTISISCSALTLNAQKGRRLLLPLEITVFAPFDISSTAQLRVRVSFLNSNALAGVFSIPTVPFLWNTAPTSFGAVATVESSNFFSPVGTLPIFTAFPAFFDLDDGTNGSYTAHYQVEVFDTLGAPFLHGSIPVTISGTAAAGQPLNVVFALDHGSSMSNTDSSGTTRLARLKAAFPVGVGLLRDTDILSVSSFANRNVVGPGPNPELPPAAAGSIPAAGGGLTQRDLAIGLANSLAKDESSPIKLIQAGITAAHTLSPTATLVLVTDGQNSGNPSTTIAPPSGPTSVLLINEPPPPTTVLNAVNAMVPLGSHYALPTPALGAFGIEKLLTGVLVGLGGKVCISDPEGSIQQGGTQRFPIHLTEADHELEAIIFSDKADALDVQLPGVRVAPPPSSGEQCAPQDKPIRGPGYVIRRLRLQALRANDRDDSPSVVVTRLGQSDSCDPTDPVRFNLTVVAKTDLMLDAEVTASGFTVGSDLLFSAVLSEYGQTWDSPGVSVRVELFHPDGGVQTLHLDKTAPGRYQTSLRSFRAGAYTAHFIATGKSLRHQRAFRRECLRTVAVFPPRDCCPPEASYATANSDG